MEAFETFEHAGYTCELHYDQDAGNPFVEFDQAAEIVWTDTAQKPYDSRDETLDLDRFSGVTHAARWLTMYGGALVALPFTITDYGSGGVRARLHEDWDDDERITGFVIVTPRGVEVTGCPDPTEAARQDFETFRVWVEGEVCGWVVRDASGEVLDSCWGYYDETTDYAAQEARESAEWHRRERLVNQEPTDVAEILASV